MKPCLVYNYGSCFYAHASYTRLNQLSLGVFSTIVRKHVLDLVRVILPIRSQASSSAAALPNPPALAGVTLGLRLKRCVSVPHYSIIYIECAMLESLGNCPYNDNNC